MAITTINNRAINRADTAASGESWTATSATASDFQAVGGANTPAFEAYYNGQQTISDATTTKLLFDTEVFDSDGTFASNRFTPAVAGKYFVYSKSHWGTGTSTTLIRVYYYLYKNAGQIAMTNTDTRDGGNFRILGSSISATVDLDADDYLEIYAFVDTSSGSPAGASASERQMFGGFKIIGA